MKNMDSLYLFILKFYKKSSMKKLQLLFSIFFVLNVVYAQNNLSLTFKYKFLNSNAGYTYPTKMEVYHNGNKIGQSSVKDQTESNQIIVDFPKGTATITAIVFAKINDKWEARTTANNYSLDFQYNKTYDWSKDATIEMVYNISSVTLDINEPDYLKKIKNTSPVIENSSDSEDEEYGSLNDDLDKYKSNIDITNSSSSSTSAYQASLTKLNDFLKTFDNGFYGKLEVKDGYIFTRFKSGSFNQFKMQDMQDAVIDEANHKVLFKCKGDIYCQTTTWKKNSNYYSHFIDENATHEQLVKLRDLLNAFKRDYLDVEKQTTSTTTTEKYTESSEFLDGQKSNYDNNSNSKSRRDEEAKKRLENSDKAGSKNKKQEDDLDWEDEDFDELATIFAGNNETSKTSGTTTNYADALKKLNDYLPVFNKDVYKNIEVKDGDVYFYFYVFNELYYSRISIIGLKEKTNLVAFSKESKVKLVCKNENKCFWSTYADEYKDHFQFFPKDNSEGTSTIQKLLDNFIKAL